jgi:ribosomal protein L29
MALDPAKLRTMTPEDLGKEELALREELWKLRLARATGQAQSPIALVRARRDLARVLTARRQHELAAAGEGRR